MLSWELRHISLDACDVRTVVGLEGGAEAEVLELRVGLSLDQG